MKKAFTLIELLVVVLIIGILSAIALPSYTRAVEKARLGEALTNIKTIETAAAEYLLSNGSFSSDTTLKDIMSSVNLSGGSWDSSGVSYTTKNFAYRGDTDYTDHNDYVVYDRFVLSVESIEKKSNDKDPDQVLYQLEVNYGPNNVYKTCYGEYWICSSLGWDISGQSYH